MVITFQFKFSCKGTNYFPPNRKIQPKFAVTTTKFGLILRFDFFSFMKRHKEVSSVMYPCLFIFSTIMPLFQFFFLTLRTERKFFPQHF